MVGWVLLGTGFTFSGFELWVWGFLGVVVI